MTKANKLLARGIPEGHAMKAFIAWKKDEKDQAVLLCDKAIADGSTVAGVLKDIISGSTKYGEDFSPQTILKIADLFPMAYRLSGDYHEKIPNATLLWLVSIT